MSNTRLLPSLLLPVVLILGTHAHAADGALVHLDTAATPAAIVKKWRVLPAEAERLTVTQEGGSTFLRMVTTSPDNVFLRQTVTLPEGTTNLRLTYRARALMVTRGEKGYHLPRIALQWDNDPTFERQTVCSFKGTKPEWESQTITVPIPAGAKALKMHAGIFACTATFDLAELDIVAQ